MDIRRIVNAYSRSVKHGRGDKKSLAIQRKPGIDALLRMETSCKLSSKLYMKDERLHEHVPNGDLVSLYESSAGKGACIIQDESVLYFCFRGANGLDDVTAALFSSNPVLFLKERKSGPKVDMPVLVHKGFKDIYVGFMDNILHDLAYVLRHVDVKRIVWAGHSMGGSVAMLCAVDACNKIGKAVKLELHTYGTPQTGNKAFVDMLPFDSFITRHPFDIVPLLNLNDQLASVEGVVFPRCIPGDESGACDAEHKPGLSELVKYHGTETYIRNVMHYRKTMEHEM